MKLPVDYTQLNSNSKRQVREEYCKLQNWSCMYCDQDLHEKPPSSILEKKITWELFPPHFLRWPIHLQHNHDTNMTEGAVHAYCNAVLWQYEGR